MWMSRINFKSVKVMLLQCWKCHVPSVQYNSLCTAVDIIHEGKHRHKCVPAPACRLQETIMCTSVIVCVRPGECKTRY